MEKKPIMVIKVLASRGKFKIGVDEDVANVADALRDLGYQTWVFEKGTSDVEIDKQLRTLGIKYFITNNFDHFADIQKSNVTPYFVIGTQRHHEPIGMARIIERFLMRFKTDSIPVGKSQNLNQQFVDAYLRKNPKKTKSGK